MTTEPQDSTDDMYKAVGAALTAFCKIEHMLYMMFAAIVAPGNASALSASFRLIKNPATKADMATSALLQHTSDKEILNKWEEIAGKIRMASDQRDIIAHFQLTMNLEEASGTVFKIPYLTPEWFDVQAAQKAGPGELKKLAVKDISNFKIKFEMLAERIHNFMNEDLGIDNRGHTR